MKVLDDGRLKKITLTTGSTREYFYQDTDSSHSYVSNKNRHLRKTLDKKSGGTTICSFEYELDPAGNRLSMKDKNGKYWSYAYDPGQQLKSETKWSAKTPGTKDYRHAYKLDGNGNRLMQYKDGVQTQLTVGDNNELTATDDGTTSWSYNTDHFGNLYYGLSSIPSLFAITYNFTRNLMDISDGTNTDAHTYDGNGRRMTSDYGSGEIRTIHDELTENLIATYTLVSSTYTLKSVNTYGLGLISTNREGTKRYFHFDGLGSTRALTDSSEVVQDTYTYSAFGETLASTGSSVNPFRYVGQWGYYDDGAMGSAFGMLLLGVRYYWPKFGRFMTWDPIFSIRKYDYARNNPILGIDPTGRQVDWVKQYFDDIFPPGEGVPNWIIPDKHRIRRVRNWNPATWTYGHCCGLSKRCNKDSQPVDCLDSACKAHDQCLTGPIDWFGCNAKLCNDILYCYSKNCIGFPIDHKQCQALYEAGTFICGSVGRSGPPGIP